MYRSFLGEISKQRISPRAITGLRHSLHSESRLRVYGFFACDKHGISCATSSAIVIFAKLQSITRLNSATFEPHEIGTFDLQVRTRIGTQRISPFTHLTLMSFTYYTRGVSLVRLLLRRSNIYTVRYFDQLSRRLSRIFLE